MKFLFMLFCIGAVAFAIRKIKKIRKNRKYIEEEENRRKNSVCLFDGKISKEEFYAMVKRGGIGIRRVINLYADEPIVYGTVRSQSGISDWSFRIDFNDYGKISGRYWLFTANYDSDIPKTVADRIAGQIVDYLN